MLTPSRYVGAEATKDDGVPFEEKFAALKGQLDEEFAEADRLAATIRTTLAEVDVNE